MSRTDLRLKRLGWFWGDEVARLLNRLNRSTRRSPLYLLCPLPSLTPRHFVSPTYNWPSARLPQTTIHANALIQPTNATNTPNYFSRITHPTPRPQPRLSLPTDSRRHHEGATDASIPARLHHNHPSAGDASSIQQSRRL